MIQSKPVKESFGIVLSLMLHEIKVDVSVIRVFSIQSQNFRIPYKDNILIDRYKKHYLQG